MNTTILPDAASKEKRMLPSVYWVLDPRLPRTAAQAAVEFDWLVQYKQGNRNIKPSYKSISKLSWLLGESVGRIPPAKSKAFVDSMGLNLLTEVFNETSSKRVSTQQDLAHAIKELLASLEKVQDDHEEISELTSMKNFCSALYEHAAACRDLVYGGQQDYPYHR